ncbi:putative 2-hydroxy-6-oxononadienedioate/2-hydroxy-6-oxononatrienedioate hydrolase [Leptospira fainei serovar Hurstbridge str. BUT 6]|uniref:2-hydroxy-6-oxononadienedioate/2-hydroxy-6-oxononatrienedioate hydrolase n=1 Tax=Leptospira fainei serovar Hurstbridge str. BUT 6 TaxID=1193011 RepID=S3UV75_9LEPT|nr:alpha/beta hydrolase [Leptospira fainei]EPG74306.1 putative 2-hydroxy-6-oxononadienedioate/2-hydroxy-6-oxononatrienedioate hydrolase [Leptospira fainei serovar Hurstbridge str. BUT 6]
MINAQSKQLSKEDINKKEIEYQSSSRIISTERRNIHLFEKGSGEPILLLHGGGPGASGISNYSRNIEELAKNFRVLVPDMPGYGKSTKGIDRKDPFGDLANSMFKLLDKLSIPKINIVGNSLGGACALRMALENPARVSALILMGPGGVDTTRSFPTKGLNRLLNYYTGSGPSLEKLNTFIRENLVYKGETIPASLIEERYKSSIDPEVVKSPPLRKPKGIPNFKNLDFTRDPRLSHCEVPTLVLWGTEDKVNRPSGGLSLQRRMPNCDLYYFNHTGHWVQWERPEEFNHITNSFLSIHAHSRNKAG